MCQGYVGSDRLAESIDTQPTKSKRHIHAVNESLCLNDSLGYRNMTPPRPVGYYRCQGLNGRNTHDASMPTVRITSRALAV